MSKPRITITIPTYNSAKSLSSCLAALINQSYQNIDINIIDSFSRDGTIKIAKKFRVKKIKKIACSLLQARYEGVKLARGKYVLILDSDQILSRDTVERAVKMMESGHKDMLALEESVYQCNTFVEKLFQMDRRLINTLNNLSPFTGVIMPRFFRKDLLKKAYDNIPKGVLPTTGGPDHAILYYEAWRISKRVGVLKDAVKHMEPSSLRHLMRKLYRWGYTSVESHYGPYSHLMKQKERLRTGLFTKGLITESFASLVLLFFKGMAFYTGYYRGVIERYGQLKNQRARY